MRIVTMAFATAALAALSVGTANAAAIGFFDDFESYGPTQLNFNGFDRLEVVNGTVDYIREPDFGLATPTGVGLVDMDGTAGDGGRLQARDAIADQRGFILAFDAAGNGRGGAADSLTFGFDAAPPPGTFMRLFHDGQFQSIAGPTFTLNSIAADQGWSHYQLSLRNFTQAFTARAFLETGSSDNLGPLVDNVRVVAFIPEPATWAMMIGGFGVAGMSLRRRRTLA